MLSFTCASRGILGIEGNGLVVIGDGGVQLPWSLRAMPPIVVGGGILGIEGNGLVVGDGGVQLPLVAGLCPDCCRRWHLPGLRAMAWS
ncbi:MAG: hypothetical protein R2911_31220 [Caldilineaceae bacterium]